MHDSSDRFGSIVDGAGPVDGCIRLSERLCQKQHHGCFRGPTETGILEIELHQGPTGQGHYTGLGSLPDLTSGTHSPVPVTLAAPTGSAMSNVTFNVGWFVTISGNQTLVRVTVAPQNPNPKQNETVSATALYSP